MDLQKAYEIITTKLQLWLHQFVRLLPNILIAALILVLGLFLARQIKRLTFRLMKKVIHQRVILNLFTTFVYVVCVSVTIFIALSVLQLDKAVTSLLAGAGIVGLALAFAFQDIAANFVAGVVMTFTKPIRIGDWITAKDHTGRVEDLRLRETVIRSFGGQMVIIPNKEIFQNPIENYTMLGRRKMELMVGVSYGDDLQKVKDVTIACLEHMKNRFTDEPIKFYYEEFADSSINFTVRIWINSPEPSVLLESRSDAIMKIKGAFDRNEITIPFPIRTIDVGIKGGEKLADIPFFKQDVENGKEKNQEDKINPAEAKR